MNSSSMAPVLINQRNQNLRLKILKNEEQRLELERKLQSMSSKTTRTHQKRQVEHIQRYFTRLNQESQRAEQRNLRLIENLTHAQEHLDRLHFDAEHLIQLKNEYCQYLESHYPNWQRPISTQTKLSKLPNELNNHLENSGNLRQVQQSYDVDSSMLVKRYEDELKVGLDRTISPIQHQLNQDHKDEQSLSESTILNQKRSGSLRMELTRNGLYFLLDYLEKEFRDAIDKKKFYRLDPPTITQKRTILDIANKQQISELKDHDSTTISMIILDQLTSTIRRTTVEHCLLTEEILSMNIYDLDRNLIAQMIPEQDRSLWLRLIDHFVQLLKNHIMNISILINKFTLAFLSPNVIYTHDKAKSLLKHVLEKLVGTQASSSDDETSSSRRQPPIQNNTKPSSSSSWMKKLTNGTVFDDGDEKSTSSSSSTYKIMNNSSAKNKDDSDQEFY